MSLSLSHLCSLKILCLEPVDSFPSHYAFSVALDDLRLCLLHSTDSVAMNFSAALYLLGLLAGASLPPPQVQWSQVMVSPPTRSIDECKAFLKQGHRMQALLKGKLHHLWIWLEESIDPESKLCLAWCSFTEDLPSTFHQLSLADRIEHKFIDSRRMLNLGQCAQIRIFLGAPKKLRASSNELSTASDDARQFSLKVDRWILHLQAESQQTRDLWLESFDSLLSSFGLLRSR